jgi:adenine-specific DNA-methyltransferase
LIKPIRLCGKEKVMEELYFTIAGCSHYFGSDFMEKGMKVKPTETQQSLFDIYTDNIKEDRTPEDLLFQVMLDLGVLLSSKIEETTIAGKKVLNITDGFLIVCFDKDVTEETVKAVAEKKPYYAVFRDSSMANDSVATNFDQIFASISPETVRKVL